MEKEKTNTPQAGKCRIFASLRFPQLRIGKAIQFTNGFLVSRDPGKQQHIIARADQNAIRDITDALIKEAPFSEGTRVYLCSPDPNLVVEPSRVEFRDGFYSTADPDRLWLIGGSAKLRSGEIREVPKGILELAAELAGAREALKAAGA